MEIYGLPGQIVRLLNHLSQKLNQFPLLLQRYIMLHINVNQRGADEHVP